MSMKTLERIVTPTIVESTADTHYTLILGGNIEEARKLNRSKKRFIGVDVLYGSTFAGAIGISLANGIIYPLAIAGVLGIGFSMLAAKHDEAIPQLERAARDKNDEYFDYTFKTWALDRYGINLANARIPSYTEALSVVENDDIYEIDSNKASSLVIRVSNGKLYLSTGANGKELITAAKKAEQDEKRAAEERRKVVLSNKGISALLDKVNAVKPSPENEVKINNIKEEIETVIREYSTNQFMGSFVINRKIRKIDEKLTVIIDSIANELNEKLAAQERYIVGRK
jgi:hypothetical protein